MGGGASSRRGKQARPEEDDVLELGMPKSLPPAYICIYCSDVVCRCRCLYCGEPGHSTKLCARRAEHASAPLEEAVEAFRAGEDPEEREILLQAFAAQSAIDWPELEGLLQDG